MTERRVLVAGVGNIFLGDDAFGVEVVRRLAERRLPDGVHVIDFGIRGFDLACVLMETYAGAIVVDAARRGGPPGTLYVLAPDLEQEPGTGAVIHGHTLPAVFSLVKAMGGQLPMLRLVCCEPQSCTEEDGLSRLSAPVEAALPEAIALVEALVLEMLAPEGSASRRLDGVRA